MMLADKTRMHVLFNPTPRVFPLDAFITGQVNLPINLDLVVSGAFQDVQGTIVGGLFGLAAPSEADLRGQLAIGNSKPILGTNKGFSGADGSITFSSRRQERYEIRKKDPFLGFTTSPVDSGVSKLASLLENGAKTEDGLFQLLNSLGKPTGKTVIATNRTERLLLVVVQPQDANPGIKFSDLNEKLLLAGADDAVACDGSTSVFINFKGKFIVPLASASSRNNNMTAIGFATRRTP